MSALFSSLQSMNDYLAESIANLEARLKKFPPGHLASYITYGKYIRYKILMPDGTSVNVSKKDRHTLILMTRKRLLEALLEDFRADHTICELMISDHVPEQSAVGRLLEEKGLREIILKYGLAADENEWSNGDFRTNSSHPEGLRFLTPNGILVRSKAEYIIAVILLELGIPFRYEAEFVLEDGGVLYPDFTLMHPQTHEIFILEHFGLMSDPSYRKNAWHKIRTYEAHGFQMDEHLICFFEYHNKPVNPKYVRDKLVDLVL